VKPGLGSLPPGVGILLFLAFGYSQLHAAPISAAPTGGPEPLSFRELTTLASVDPPPADLARKLADLLSTPFISNEAAARDSASKPADAPSPGHMLRVAEWNINRGLNEREIELALAGSKGYLAAASRNPGLKAKDLSQAAREIHELAQADVIVLDEVDDGVKRTHYHNVARDLAKVLNMNYVYGVEFIELDRIYLGVKNMDVEDPFRNFDGEVFGLDPQRYLGLEGSAILSRYPIRGARMLRLPERYDWYHGEIKAISDLERLRRWTSQQLFEERIARQVRRGGRMAIVVDLDVPQSSTGVVTLVCPHLENYTNPKGRREQLDYVLRQIREISNPVILAGDFNTTGRTAQPINIRKEILKYVTDYHFWARQVFFWVTPVPGLGLAFRAADYIKNYHDPTAFSVPILLANHSRPLFQDLRKFRFSDGGMFNFDGNRKASYRHRGSTLADSNQRAWKGFAPTFSFQRTYHGLVGEYKIDWFFVKSPRRKGLPAPAEAASFAPFFGRTLPTVNTALGSRISDHSPITVSVPLGLPSYGPRHLGE